MNNYLNNSFGAYLDSFYTVILKVKNDTLVNEVLLVSEDSISLSIINRNFFNDYALITLHSDELIDPQVDYEVIINDNIKYHLNIGAITLTKEFEEKYFFNDWLGYKYTKTNVTFRLYAPVSKEVVLVVNDTNTYLLKDIGSGVYEVKVSNKNEWLDGASYYY